MLINYFVLAVKKLGIRKFLEILMSKMLTTNQAAERTKKFTAQDWRSYFKLMNSSIISNKIYLASEEEFVTFCQNNNIELNNHAEIR